jgi:hypothetical protein
MGLGQSIGNDHSLEYLELLIEVGCVPVRDSILFCNRQWPAIQLWFLPRMVCGTVYPELVFYADTSPSKRTSRGDQKDPNNNIEEKARAWVDFLSEVIQSYKTTTWTPTGETLFALSFGMEAVIPVEIGSLSYRVEHYNPGLNNVEMKLHLDLLQERRDKA